MRFIAGCWRLRLAGLMVAMSWFAACAMGGSERVPVCPPVVEYDPEFRARAADELVLLPDGAAIVEMLGDYAVMRDQARACRSDLRRLPHFSFGMPLRNRSLGSISCVNVPVIRRRERSDLHQHGRAVHEGDAKAEAGQDRP